MIIADHREERFAFDPSRERHYGSTSQRVRLWLANEDALVEN